MKFWREVPIHNLTPEMMSLDKQGDMVLKWKEESIEIWIPMSANDGELSAIRGN